MNNECQLASYFSVAYWCPQIYYKTSIFICYYSFYIKETEQINCCLQNLGKSQNSIQGILKGLVQIVPVLCSAYFYKLYVLYILLGIPYQRTSRPFKRYV